MVTGSISYKFDYSDTKTDGLHRKMFWLSTKAADDSGDRRRPWVMVAQGQSAVVI